nr:hypothetical protein [Tanacetum cinerariifolium]
LDEVNNLQCDYLELLEKCKCLETELSKSTMMSKSFEALQKHAINLEIDLQQCQEKIKNEKSFKENQSKEFRKEREQYFEIQDLKAQLQDKGIVIIIQQPDAFKSQRPSVLGKPTTFSNSFKRKDFLKSKLVTQNIMSNDFSKPVTAQTLPPNKKSILKNTNVLVQGMYKLHTEHNQARTSQLPQDSRKTNKRVSFSIGVISTISVSRPQLKSNPLGDRVTLNNSQGKKQEVEDQRRSVKLPKNKTEYYYANHINAILGVYTELDEVTNLQCDYPELLKKCEGMYKLHTDHNQARISQLPQDSRKTNKRVSFSTGVIPTTSVSRPQLKRNPMGDRVMRNNSQGKKQEVEDQRRNVKFLKNKTSVTAWNENPEITLNQVIEDAHVTLSNVIKKTEVPVTSSSHSSDLASKFLNFSDIPHTDAKIISPMDVYVHHEVPSNQTPTLLTILVLVITESSPIFTTVIQQSLPSFTSLPQQSTLTPPPITEATNPLSTLLNSHLSSNSTTDMVTKSLEYAVLAKESSQPKSTYEAAALLTEFELKKILIYKMDESQSYLTAAEHRECYDGLIKSYDIDKNRGLKKRKTSKDAEPTKGLKDKESQSGSSQGAKSQSKSFRKSIQLEEPEFEVADADMPQDQEKNLGNDDEKPKGKLHLNMIALPNLNDLKNPLILIRMLARLLNKDQLKTG